MERHLRLNSNYAPQRQFLPPFQRGASDDPWNMQMSTYLMMSGGSRRPADNGMAADSKRAPSLTRRGRFSGRIKSKRHRSLCKLSDNIRQQSTRIQRHQCQGARGRPIGETDAAHVTRQLGYTPATEHSTNGTRRLTRLLSRPLVGHRQVAPWRQPTSSVRPTSSPVTSSGRLN